MKKLKDLKIEESSEEVKGEGEMQWGGDYVSFLLLSWFRVEPGVDLSKQNHEGLSSQCRCSSMQIWFCGWGGGGGADSHHPPHLFNNSFNPLSPSRSWYISSHLHVFTHRYVLIHTSLFLSNLCLLSLTLLVLFLPTKTLKRLAAPVFSYLFLSLTLSDIPDSIARCWMGRLAQGKKRRLWITAAPLSLLTHYLSSRGERERLRRKCKPTVFPQKLHRTKEHVQPGKSINPLIESHFISDNKEWNNCSCGRHGIKK